eukprot:342897-Chlamydomonas_euryale.AAC.4
MWMENADRNLSSTFVALCQEAIFGCPPPRKDLSIHPAIHPISGPPPPNIAMTATLAVPDAIACNLLLPDHNQCKEQHS